jgi:hypothetical protein
MKKITILAIALSLAIAASGQKSIDDLFEKYGGKDGFVTVTINGNLLKLAASFDEEKEVNDNKLPSDISLIRILATDEDNKDSGINFHDLVIKDLDVTNYEEFMRVKEKDQDVRMLVKTSGKIFSEFLLIVGGKDNALIQIKGSMTFEEAKKFADDAKKNHGNNINIGKN